MKGGHRILYSDSVLAPIKLLMSDPCPFGLPGILMAGRTQTPGQILKVDAP